MIHDIESAMKCIRASGMKVGKPMSCANCVAFVVRNNKYICLIKPFKCDDTGHPITKCPKPKTQGVLKKIKDLLGSTGTL